jgi:hypothetical protein
MSNKNLPLGPRIRTIRPSATSRYYILENRETGERETERSFETLTAAIAYVTRNYGAGRHLGAVRH